MKRTVIILCWLFGIFGISLWLVSILGGLYLMIIGYDHPVKILLAMTTLIFWGAILCGIATVLGD